LTDGAGNSNIDGGSTSKAGDAVRGPDLISVAASCTRGTGGHADASSVCAWATTAIDELEPVEEKATPVRLPGWHCVHEDASTTETQPAAQSLHTVQPDRANLPELQPVQVDEATAAENDPANKKNKVTTWYLDKTEQLLPPAEQLVQVLAPETKETLPGGQSEQPVPPGFGANLPAPQAVQSARPTSGCALPTSHLVATRTDGTQQGE
jgi:hypothetical protein